MRYFCTILYTTIQNIKRTVVLVLLRRLHDHLAETVLDRRPLQQSKKSAHSAA